MFLSSQRPAPVQLVLGDGVEVRSVYTFAASNVFNNVSISLLEWGAALPLSDNTEATDPSVRAASRQLMSCMLITVIFQIKTFDTHHMVLRSYFVLGNGRCGSTAARHSCSRQQILNSIIQPHSLLFTQLNVEVTRAHGFAEGGSSTNLGSLKTKKLN
jgi:hypothetical protein